MRSLWLCLALWAAPASGHEFWLEPLAYRVSPNARIEARARNGEDFEGVEYSYSPRGYARSGIIAGGAEGPIPGDSGQCPAVQVAPLAEGLNVLYHASAASRIVYPDMAKFEKFLRGKRLEAALEIHRAKGFPTEKISESYYRFVKALVAVGDGAGADRAVGLPFELVAETNPYTERTDITYRLLWQGEPDANAPVFFFLKQGEEVEKTELMTDAEGRVTIPRVPGEYMINAVRIVEAAPPDQERMNAVWTTLWAASTYRVFE